MTKFELSNLFARSGPSRKIYKIDKSACCIDVSIVGDGGSMREKLRRMGGIFQDYFRKTVS
jgi:hypothetical protein